jgi:hypothetical protein
MKIIVCMFLVILFFTACGLHEIIEVADDEATSCELASDITMPEDTANEPTTTLPEEPNDEPEPKLDDEIKNDEPIEKDTPLMEPPKTYEQLHENLFVGGGEWFVTGGDELSWWYVIFGGAFNTFPQYLIDRPVHGHTGIVTSEEFNEWIRQFTSGSLNGWRDHRDSNLLTFIRDFNISREDYIQAVEREFDKTMEEIDALVTSARAMNLLTMDEEEWKISVWRHFTSLSDIDALYSNDVRKLWESFPGEGVMQNGIAYSPEWIMHNVERAINEEQIHFEEILRIVDRASWHYELQQVTIEAVSTIQEIAVVDHAVHEFFFEENNITLE